MPARRPAPRLPWWSLAPVAAAAAYVTVRLRGAARFECDLSGPAGDLDLVALGAVLLLVNVVGVVILTRTCPRFWAVAASLLLVGAGFWSFMLMTSPPEDYPSPRGTCVHNVPTWWPHWLPD